MARREKKPVHKVVMTEGKRNIIQQLLQEYDIETAEDIQDALKDLLGGTIKEMMEAEMDEHLGYQKSERSDSDDYRNGYKSKRVQISDKRKYATDAFCEPVIAEMYFFLYRVCFLYDGNLNSIRFGQASVPGSFQNGTSAFYSGNIPQYAILRSMFLQSL